MSIVPAHLQRPFLFLLFLGLAAFSLLALRPGDPPRAISTITTPTATVVRQAAPTSTPTRQPPPETSPEAVDNIPTPAPKTIQTPAPTPERIQEHIIQAGESIDSIAIQYGITAASITGLNFLAQPDLVFPGQTLLIPLYADPTPAPDLIKTAIENALAEDRPQPAVLGYSVLDQPIELYTFGSGSNTLIFIGGMHGGYEWNTTTLAYEFIDYFTEEPTAVPESVTLYIIPAANPDGIVAVSGQTGPISPTNIIVSDTFPARFNANGVDLNRNWTCEWSPIATWWDTNVSGGSAPYSEVENQILLAFINSQKENLRGVIFWHSFAFLISPGQCGDQPHQPSWDIAAAYAQGARYPIGGFNLYPVTGEASNSLTQMGIPSFSVELSTHDETDWARNLAGMRTLLAQYNQD